MKIMISIFLAFMGMACGHHPGKDPVIIAYFHERLAKVDIEKGDLQAIRKDMAGRRNPDHAAYLDHLAFADRLLQSRLGSLPPSDPRAEAYMKAISEDIVATNFLKAQAQ